MISTENVVKEYKGGVSALNGVTIEVEKGEFVFLVGPSGSGKTTLLNAIGAIIEEPLKTHGIAKGAGMIHPNMATTIGVIMTDATLSPEQADSILRRAVDRSFNCISVDGHTSTSDTFVTLANGLDARGAAGQRKSLVLLAVIACAPNGGITREKLLGYFWPEEDRERARHFLSDALFRLRKSLGRDVLVLAGDDIRIAAVLGTFRVAEQADRLVLLDGGREVASGAPKDVLTEALRPAADRRTLLGDRRAGGFRPRGVEEAHAVGVDMHERCGRRRIVADAA